MTENQKANPSKSDRVAEIAKQLEKDFDRLRKSMVKAVVHLEKSKQADKEYEEHLKKVFPDLLEE